MKRAKRAKVGWAKFSGLGALRLSGTDVLFQSLGLPQTRLEEHVSAASVTHFVAATRKLVFCTPLKKYGDLVSAR